MGGIPFPIHDASVEDFFVSTSSINPSNKSAQKTNTDHDYTVKHTSSDITTAMTTVKSHTQSTSLISSNTNSTSNHDTNYFFYPFRTYKAFIIQFKKELVNNVFKQLRNIPPSYYHQMVADGYYPSKNNNTGSNKHHKHNHNHKNSYNLSMIELICKIVLFDYIGPVSLSVNFTKFGYKYFYKREVLESDSRKRETNKNYKEKISSFSTSISGACALHCPNIIYNNMNNKPFCENIFGFIIFASNRLEKILTSPLYFEMESNIDRDYYNYNSSDNNISYNNEKRKGKCGGHGVSGIFCNYRYSDPGQYNRDKQMSILPLHLPYRLMKDSIRTVTQRAKNSIYGHEERNLGRYNSMILETFSHDDHDELKNGDNAYDNDNDVSGIVYRQHIVLIWEQCWWSWRGENTIDFSELKIMCNPNQFNPFMIDTSEKTKVVGFEIENIANYASLSHLNKNGTFKNDNYNNNNNSKTKGKNKNTTKNKTKTKTKTKKKKQKSQSFCWMNQAIEDKFTALGDIGRKWSGALRETQMNKKSSLLFKQGMFGLNCYINNDKNGNNKNKNGDENDNYNRGYYLLFCKKGILLWQLNADYLLGDNNVNANGACELLIFGSLPHGKMFGEYGEDITKDLIINYLTKINDKNSKKFKPLQHQIMQNYFYFSHFRILNKMIFGNILDDYNNIDAAYDSKRNLLFACVKLANFNLKILVYNNNNNINNNTATTIAASKTTCTTQDITIKPIDVDEEKLGQNTNVNDRDNHKNDKDNTDNNSTPSKPGGKRRRRRGRGRSSKKKTDSCNNKNSNINIHVTGVLGSENGQSNAYGDTSQNLIIFDCPLDSTVVNEDEDEDKDKDEAAMSFILDFDDRSHDESRRILCKSGGEQMILMFHSYENDATYILTRQVITIKNGRWCTDYDEYLRLIELKGEIIYPMIQIHGIYLKFDQLINNGVIIYKQKHVDVDLQWTDKYQHFTIRADEKSKYRSSPDLLTEWIFNDNDNCIVGYGDDLFVMIPLSQLLFD